MPDLDFKQADRLLRLTDPSDKADVLLPMALSCAERVSGLYAVSFSAAAELAKEDEIDPADFLGKTLGVGVAGRKLGSELHYDDDLSHFHGVVTRFSVGEQDDYVRRYEIELAPWLWLLTQSADCRVYQDQDPE